MASTLHGAVFGGFRADVSMIPVQSRCDDMARGIGPIQRLLI